MGCLGVVIGSFGSSEDRLKSLIRSEIRLGRGGGGPRAGPCASHLTGSPGGYTTSLGTMATRLLCAKPGYTEEKPWGLSGNDLTVRPQASLPFHRPRFPPLAD